MSKNSKRRSTRIDNKVFDAVVERVRKNEFLAPLLQLGLSDSALTDLILGHDCSELYRHLVEMPAQLGGVDVKRVVGEDEAQSADKDTTFTETELINAVKVNESARDVNGVFRLMAHHIRVLCVGAPGREHLTFYAYRRHKLNDNPKLSNTVARHLMLVQKKDGVNLAVKFSEVGTALSRSKTKRFLWSNFGQEQYKEMTRQFDARNVGISSRQMLSFPPDIRTVLHRIKNEVTTELKPKPSAARSTAEEGGMIDGEDDDDDDGMHSPPAQSPSTPRERHAPKPTETGDGREGENEKKTKNKKKKKEKKKHDEEGGEQADDDAMDLDERPPPPWYQSTGGGASSQSAPPLQPGIDAPPFVHWLHAHAHGTPPHRAPGTRVQVHRLRRGEDGNWILPGELAVLLQEPVANPWTVALSCVQPAHPAPREMQQLESVLNSFNIKSAEFNALLSPASVDATVAALLKPGKSNPILPPHQLVLVQCARRIIQNLPRLVMQLEQRAGMMPEQRQTLFCHIARLCKAAKEAGLKELVAC